MQKTDEPTKEEIQIMRNAFQIMKAGTAAAEEGRRQFHCPVCGGVGKCWKSKVNGHRGAICPTCNLGFRE